jgi:hypothetical protein
MKKILLAAALAFATPAHAQVHYPIITVTGNVTIIDTGIHETWGGEIYDERLYIMTGFGAPNTQSESAEWFPIGPAFVPPPPPPVVINNPPPPVVIPPPCDECGFPKPTPSPVPEASTWAMMITGFLGLGYAYLRRKRLA